jgi:transposase
VPADHPLLALRRTVDEVLRERTRSSDRVYVKTGRPSIAPERLLRALLQQVFYSIRANGMPTEQLDYTLLFHGWGRGQLLRKISRKNSAPATLRR